MVLSFRADLQGGKGLFMRLLLLFRGREPACMPVAITE